MTAVWELQSKTEGTKLRGGGTATKANAFEVPKNAMDVDDDATASLTTATDAE